MKYFPEDIIFIKDTKIQYKVNLMLCACLDCVVPKLLDISPTMCRYFEYPIKKRVIPRCMLNFPAGFLIPINLYDGGNR